jgi:hypothetical protein
MLHLPRGTFIGDHPHTGSNLGSSPGHKGKGLCGPLAAGIRQGIRSTVMKQKVMGSNSAWTPGQLCNLVLLTPSCDCGKD